MKRRQGRAKDALTVILAGGTDQRPGGGDISRPGEENLSHPWVSHVVVDADDRVSGTANWTSAEGGVGGEGHDRCDAFVYGVLIDNQKLGLCRP